MEGLLESMTPSQKFLLLAFNVWFYIIFPVIVIRKLNYLTRIMEAQFEQDDAES